MSYISPSADLILKTIMKSYGGFVEYKLEKTQTDLDLLQNLTMYHIPILASRKQTSTWSLVM